MQRAATWTMFLGVVAGLAYVCFAMLRPFADVIAWSAVLAVICYPVHRRLVRTTGRVALSAFMTSVLTVFAFLVPLVVIGAIAVTECAALGQSLRAEFRSPDQWLARTAASLAGRAGVGPDAIAAWLHQHADDWMRTAGHYTMAFALGAFGAIATSLLVVVALFLLLRDGDRIVAAIPDLLPFDRARGQLLLRRIRDAVHASVYGVVVVALLHGVVYGTTFRLLGVPSAALWGTVTVFASVVPVVGIFSVWGPVAVYLALNGHWPQVVLLVLVASLASGIEHVLRPRLVAGRVGLSEVAMFFALLGGVMAFGALGVVLGPVAFATAAAIVDVLREPSSDGAPADETGARAA